MSGDYKIAVIGLWHLGETYSIGLAELGHQVVGIDSDKKVVSDLSAGILPLPEPGLKELLRKNLDAGRLSFTTDFSEIGNCNVLWFTFDTPVNENDEVNLDVIYNSLRKSIPYLKDGVLIVMTSQVPVGTGEDIKRVISKNKPELIFDYLYAPENLRLGDALGCFFEPPRIVIGGESEKARREISKIFSGLKTEFLNMSVPSAEVSKHALNAYLATTVSFINDVADVCEKVGADIIDVSRALRADPRVGSKAFIDAGLGFSGGTLGRDLKALLSVSEKQSLESPIIRAVLKKNFERKALVAKRLQAIKGSLAGKPLAIFGLTYKAGTRTLRRSSALEIANDLGSLGADVRLNDPQALPEEVNSLSASKFFRDPYEAARDCEAIILCTPWPEFKKLDFAKLGKVAGRQPVFLDTANFLWEMEEEIKKAGFAYLGIGRR